MGFDLQSWRRRSEGEPRQCTNGHLQHRSGRAHPARATSKRRRSSAACEPEGPLRVQRMRRMKRHDATDKRSARARQGNGRLPPAPLRTQSRSSGSSNTGDSTGCHLQQRYCVFVLRLSPVRASQYVSSACAWYTPTLPHWFFFALFHDAGNVCYLIIPAGSSTLVNVPAVRIYLLVNIATSVRNDVLSFQSDGTQTDLEQSCVYGSPITIPESQ
jgi:hypothetical protein